jgi:excisionase family DNA binding protein
MNTLNRGSSPSEHSAASGRMQLLTVLDIMTELRISRSSVYRLFDSGDLPWVQIGKSRRVKPQDLAHFIEQHRRLAS